MTRKQIVVPLTEEDVELFKELIQFGQPIDWTFDGIDILFVSREHRKVDLENEIKEIYQSMEHTGFGSKQLRILASLEKELEELE